MICFKQKSYSSSFLLFLFLLSFVCNLYYIQWHPFLHQWDECFHALVAKNFSTDILMPMLYRYSPIPVCDYNWSCCTVWLHKQPLFLWQMALSIRIFGINEWAIRFPSALQLSLLVFPVYRIGKIVFSAKTGLLAAAFTVSNWFIIEHIDGFIGMDHNDIAFMFYVILSIWALLEYILNPSLKMAVVMGLFSGCAMLNKWLVGLVAFEGLFFYFLFFNSLNRKTVFQFFVAISIALAVFLPWQIYTYIQYKPFAIHEWMYNQKHFWEAVEGHSHEQFYYFNILKLLFPHLTLLLLIGILLSLFKRTKSKFVLPLLIMIFSLFVFFTLAATKVNSYIMVVMPLLFVFIAFGIVEILFFAQQLLSGWNIVFMPIILLLLWFNFNFKQIQTDHACNQNNWQSRENLVKRNNTVTLKSIPRYNLPEKTILLLPNEFGYVDAMFYTGLLSYGDQIPKEQLKLIEKMGFSIAVFQNHIPETTKDLHSVIILPLSIIK